MISKLITNPSEAAAHSASMQKQASAYHSNNLIMVMTCNDWYFYVTTPAGVGDLQYGGTVCSTRYYNTGGGGGGGGSGSGDGSGGGGGSPGTEQPNPCKTILAYKATTAHHTTGNPTPIPPGGYDGDDDDGFPPPTSPTTPVSDLPCPQGEPSLTYTITNNVTDSCLHKMVDDVIGSNVSGKINALIQKIFGGNSSINLTFTDAGQLTQPTRDAETYSTITNNILTSTEIHLKQSVLSASSKEFIAATIMHEALHAYLDYNGIEMDESHNQMAKAYVTTMKNDLQAMFPGMVDDVAYSLAWGGLEDAYLYQHPTPDVYIPQYQSQLNTLLRAHTYDGHQYGHGCN